LLVREAQDVEAFRFKECIAFLIGLLTFVEVMRSTVEFDDELDRQTSEVSDVIPERDLAPETKAVYPIGLQLAP
jgi:hypothetical protein